MGPPPRFVPPQVRGHTSLVGRQVDTFKAASELARHRLLTIKGPPGIGKSALAAELVSRLLDRRTFRDGALLVPLGHAQSVAAARNALQAELLRSTAHSDSARHAPAPITAVDAMEYPRKRATQRPHGMEPRAGEETAPGPSAASSRAGTRPHGAADRSRRQTSHADQAPQKQGSAASQQQQQQRVAGRARRRRSIAAPGRAVRSEAQGTATRQPQPLGQGGASARTPPRPGTALPGAGAKGSTQARRPTGPTPPSPNGRDRQGTASLSSRGGHGAQSRAVKPQAPPPLRSPRGRRLSAVIRRGAPLTEAAVDASAVERARPASALGSASTHAHAATERTQQPPRAGEEGKKADAAAAAALPLSASLQRAVSDSAAMDDAAPPAVAASSRSTCSAGERPSSAHVAPRPDATPAVEKGAEGPPLQEEPRHGEGGETWEADVVQRGVGGEGDAAAATSAPAAESPPRPLGSSPPLAPPPATGRVGADGGDGGGWKAGGGAQSALLGADRGVGGPVGVPSLAGADVLIVLDNAEALLAADPAGAREWLRELLEQSPRLRLLLTSRVALGGGVGEQSERVILLRRLDPLGAARLFTLRMPSYIKDVDALPPSPSPSSSPSPSAPPAATGGAGEQRRGRYLALLRRLASHPLLRFLDGHPHAITLAAPLMQDRSLDEVQALVESGVDELRVQGLPAATRSASDTLAISLQASLEHLRAMDPFAVVCFALVGLMPGGMLATDVDRIWGCTGWRAHASALVHGSLLERRRVRPFLGAAAIFRHLPSCSASASPSAFLGSAIRHGEGGGDDTVPAASVADSASLGSRTQSTVTGFAPSVASVGAGVQRRLAASAEALDYYSTFPFVTAFASNLLAPDTPGTDDLARHLALAPPAIAAMRAAMATRCAEHLSRVSECVFANIGTMSAEAEVSGVPQPSPQDCLAPSHTHARAVYPASPPRARTSSCRCTSPTSGLRCGAWHGRQRRGRGARRAPALGRARRGRAAAGRERGCRR